VAQKRLALKARRKIAQLAFGAATLKMTALQRGDARRIVATIFKPLQRLNEPRRDRFTPDDSNYAAHKPLRSPLRLFWP
jgi:hypothetical protein